MNYLPYILFFIAAMFNAVSETLKFHFKTSVFQTLDPKKWDVNVNWQYINNFLGIMRIEPYHIAKTMMLGCFVLAVYFHQEPNLIDIPILWGCWFIGFESIWRLLSRPYMETPSKYL